MSQQINLFNPVFLKQKKYFSSIAMVRAFSVLVFGSALMAAYAQYQISTFKRQSAHIGTQLATAQKQLNQVKIEYGAKPENQSLVSQVKNAEAEIASLKKVFETVRRGDIGNTDGYSAYFRAFARQSMEGVWLTGLQLNGAGSKIEVQGRTVSPELLPSYINRLKREEIMQGKSFGTLEMKTPADPAVATVVTVAPAESQAVAAPEYIEFRLR